MRSRGDPPWPNAHPGPPDCEELGVCLEMVQLMENVFLNLQLNDFWDHPDNRGRALLFTKWARSPTFREAWKSIHDTFGLRFRHFCQNRLGLR